MKGNQLGISIEPKKIRKPQITVEISNSVESHPKPTNTVIFRRTQINNCIAFSLVTCALVLIGIGIGVWYAVSYS